MGIIITIIIIMEEIDQEIKIIIEIGTEIEIEKKKEVNRKGNKVQAQVHPQEDHLLPLLQEEEGNQNHLLLQVPITVEEVEAVLNQKILIILIDQINQKILNQETQIQSNHFDSTNFILYLKFILVKFF